MVRGVRWYVVGCVILVALAGCGRGLMQYVQREPWRDQAEVACLQSGTVREGPGLVRVAPIDGPGVCGATHPLKVAAFSAAAAFGYAEEAVRPPGSIPGASQPRWPIATQPLAPPAVPRPRYVPSAGPRMLTPPPGAEVYAPPPAVDRYTPPAGAPMSITPPGINPYGNAPEPQYPYPQRVSPSRMPGEPDDNED